MTRQTLTFLVWPVLPLLGLAGVGVWLIVRARRRQAESKADAARAQRLQGDYR